jgi:hypothetical protein
MFHYNMTSIIGMTGVLPRSELQIQAAFIL